jgi:glycosyltransferase involved in cell wall biosynthesis
MRIILLMRRFPPVSFGGGELSALSLVRELLSKGHDVTVLTGIDHPGTGRVPLPGDLSARLKVVPDIDARPSDGGKHWTRAAGRAIEEHLEGHDVLHVHDPILIPAAVKHRRVPVVATINDMRATCYYSMHFRRGAHCPECSGEGLKECLSDWGGNRLMASFILRRTREATAQLNDLDGILPRSTQVEEVLRRNGVETPAVICPPLVHGPFDVSPAPGSQLAGYVGRIDRGKGIDTAIKALGRTKDVRLRIVGSGPYLEEYQQLAEGQGVADRVEFTGPVDHEEIAAVIAGMDVVLIPSARLEAMPRALIEAAYAARAVVVSDATGGHEFVIPEETGFVFKAGNASSLAAALRRAFNSDLEAMGRNALAHVESDYDVSGIVDRVIELYKTTMGDD